MKREDVFKQVKLPEEVISVPAWGGDVVVRGLTGIERDELESDSVVPGWRISPANFRGRLLVRVLLDPETREPIFGPDDADRLGAMPAAVLQPMFEVAMRLSGLSEEAVAELGKDSAAPGGDLSSTSYPSSEE